MSRQPLQDSVTIEVSSKQVAAEEKLQEDSDYRAILLEAPNGTYLLGLIEGFRPRSRKSLVDVTAGDASEDDAADSRQGSSSARSGHDEDLESLEAALNDLTSYYSSRALQMRAHAASDVFNSTARAAFCIAVNMGYFLVVWAALRAGVPITGKSLQGWQEQQLETDPRVIGVMVTEASISVLGLAGLYKRSIRTLAVFVLAQFISMLLVARLTDLFFTPGLIFARMLQLLSIVLVRTHILRLERLRSQPGRGAAGEGGSEGQGQSRGNSPRRDDEGRDAENPAPRRGGSTSRIDDMFTHIGGQEESARSASRADALRRIRSMPVVGAVSSNTGRGQGAARQGETSRSRSVRREGGVEAGSRGAATGLSRSGRGRGSSTPTSARDGSTTRPTPAQHSSSSRPSRGQAGTTPIVTRPVMNESARLAAFTRDDAALWQVMHSARSEGGRGERRAPSERKRGSKSTQVSSASSATIGDVSLSPRADRVHHSGAGVGVSVSRTEAQGRPSSRHAGSQSRSRGQSSRRVELTVNTAADTGVDVPGQTDDYRRESRV